MTTQLNPIQDPAMHWSALPSHNVNFRPGQPDLAVFRAAQPAYLDRLKSERPGAMSRHLASTPPAGNSRSSTPQPLASRGGSGSVSGIKRSHIVPFNRPSSGSAASEDGGAGSFKAGEEAVQRLSASLQQQRSRLSVSQDGMSFAEYSASHGSLRRPERRSSSQFARGPGFVRQEGFLDVEPAQHATEATVTSPRPPVAPGGLLSRQFSCETVPVARSVAKPSAEQLKERLQKCYEKSPTEPVEGGDIDPALLLRTLQMSFETFHNIVVVRAFNIAKAAHVGSSAPLVRSGEVARILADLEASENCIAAALLHTALESSMLTEQKLREAMCPEVCNIVCNVAKMSDICKIHRELVQSQAGISEALHQKFLAMLLAMEDVPAVLIVLADHLHLMRTAPTKEAAQDALDVFAPLANRLGVWSIKAELEDLSFKALHPTEHAELQAKCEESQRRGTIEANLDQLKGVLAGKGLQGDLSGRPKNLWGVYRKMLQKGYGLDQVYDVRALRVVVESKADCYEMLREVHRLWSPVEGRFKDYIRHKKENGYQSLHTVVLGADGVPMEVQIRTRKMHWIAEYGVAAHWRYKEAVDEHVSQAQQVAWSRYLVSFQMELADKKCRPSGSPPKDSSFLNLHMRICAFPTHDSGCKFADYFQRNNFLPVERPVGTPSTAPVYVILSDGRKGSSPENSPANYRIEQLPSGFTTGELADQLSQSAQEDGSHLRMLVNHKEVISPLQQLEQCDRVEVFESGWAEANPLQPGVHEVEHSRQLLQRIFTRSGSLSGDFGTDFGGFSLQRGTPVGQG